MTPVGDVNAEPEAPAMLQALADALSKAIAIDPAQVPAFESIAWRLMAIADQLQLLHRLTAPELNERDRRDGMQVVSRIAGEHTYVLIESFREAFYRRATVLH